MNKPTEQLIFDRTLQDVLSDTDKGNYNVTDLNRIGEWENYLKEKLIADGYTISISPKTDWNTNDVPTQSQIDKIKNDLLKIKNSYLNTLNINLKVGQDYVEYDTANDIERLIDKLYRLLDGMEQYYVRCGVARCGQNRVWQHRFRGSKTWNRIPYNAFNDVPETLQIYTIANPNDSINPAFEKDGSVYGNVLYYNNYINELDELIGDING